MVRRYVDVGAYLVENAVPRLSRVLRACYAHSVFRAGSAHVPHVRGGGEAAKIREKNHEHRFWIRIFFSSATTSKFYMPLLGEFWRSSRDSFVSGYGTDESWDVRQNSVKSGFSNFGKMSIFGNEKSLCVGTGRCFDWSTGDVLIGAQEMS